MEEIKFKPKITADIISSGMFFLAIYTVIAVIISILVFNQGILAVISTLLSTGFIFILIYMFTLASIILSKIFLTYYITKNNEIIIEYSFLQKSTKVYRIDQITTLTFNQNFIEKKLGLGTISFDIFGLSPASNSNSQQENNQMVLPRLSTISQYEKIYDMISKQLNITTQDSLIEKKPKTSPVKAISVILVGIPLIVGIISISLDSRIWPISFSVTIIIGIIMIITIKRLHNTKYSISQNYAMISHNYFLSTMIQKIPITKITNLKNSKNMVIYSLFKTGTTYVYTGGMKDPVFKLLEDFTTFSNYLSSLTKGEKISAKHSNNEDSTTNEKMLFNRSTHFIYFIKKSIITSLLFLVIFAIFFTIAFIFAFSFIWSLIIGIIYLISITLHFLYWRSLSYEFYDNKVIKQSGIFTMVSEELQYKNIKYISLHRGFILDRIANTGTINLYTAGTSSVDKSIIQIKNYNKVYEEFEQLLSS